MAGYSETGPRLLQLAQRVRVPAGFILAPLMLIAARPTRFSLAVGAAVAMIGLGVRAWASGCLKKNEELAILGPYSYTRNPLYLGTFVLGLGISISTGSWWFAGIFVGFYMLLYIPVMIAEAQTLRRLFPNDYPAYSERVPLLVPRFRGSGSPLPGSHLSDRKSGAGRVFDFSLYIRHREYRALLGFVTVLGILILKAWLSP